MPGGGPLRVRVVVPRSATRSPQGRARIRVRGSVVAAGKNRQYSVGHHRTFACACSWKTRVYYNLSGPLVRGATRNPGGLRVDDATA